MYFAGDSYKDRLRDHSARVPALTCVTVTYCVWCVADGCMAS